MDLKKLSHIPSWEWPRNARTLVLETLTNGKAPEKNRLLAAELAGEIVIMNDKLGKALLGVIESNEEPADLRSRAAISLGPGLEEADLLEYDDIDDQPCLSEAFVRETQHSFRQMYSDTTIPKTVRRSLLESSVRQPQDWHTGAIRGAAESDDHDWQLTAVFCMQYVRGFEEQILQYLKSAEPDILFHAVEAAGTWGIDAAWPTVAKLVTASDTEKQIRLAAIEAAAAIRPTEANILEPLIDSYDEDISEAAMDALRRAQLFAGEFDEDEEEENEDEEDDFDEDDYDEDDFEEDDFDDDDEDEFDEEDDFDEDEFDEEDEDEEDDDEESNKK